MRTIVDIPEDDIRWLDAKAAETGKSRTALVREAVEAFRAETTSEPERMLAALREGFGAWKDRAESRDAVEWQRRERAGWTRPWDADYEDVKAEFPDLFDEEDDRQRQVYLAMASSRKREAK